MAWGMLSLSVYRVCFGLSIGFSVWDFWRRPGEATAVVSVSDARRLWSSGIESSDGVRLIFVERFVAMHLFRASFLTFCETGYIETDELRGNY